jgi:DNA-binding transcriptional regulator YiaG
MKTQDELIRLKEKTGMNWKAFAQYFDIPYRTMQDWYLGKRSMPDYLLRLMSYKIETEKLRRPR